MHFRRSSKSTLIRGNGDSLIKTMYGFTGWAEDLIVSSSNESFLPISMEGVIESHSFVDAALMTDRGEAGMAFLMEPQAKVKCE